MSPFEVSLLATATPIFCAVSGDILVAKITAPLTHFMSLQAKRIYVG